MTLTSCGNPVESVMAGSWNLETLNGKPIPVQLSTGFPIRLLVDAKLLINPDGTYTYDLAYSVFEGVGLGPAKLEAKSEKGEWVRSGDDVTLTNDATGAKMSGRVFGTRMRLTAGTDVHDFNLILIDPTLDGGKDSRMTDTNQD